MGIQVFPGEVGLKGFPIIGIRHILGFLCKMAETIPETNKNKIIIRQGFKLADIYIYAKPGIRSFVGIVK